MLTQAPPTASQYSPPPPGERPDDLSGRRHRQVIGYLGLALPNLLVLLVWLRPNPQTDKWFSDSISAYYWTGAVSLFVGILSALSLFLFTYRGYANEFHKYDRGAAIIAGIAAALIVLFPTTPPRGITPLPWWHDWINTTHLVASIALFSMFAVFSLWLFRKTASNKEPPADKKRRNAIYLVCGFGILISMAWAVVVRNMGRSTFWPESLGIGCFACSWLVKGEAVDSISSTLWAVKAKVTK